MSSPEDESAYQEYIGGIYDDLLSHDALELRDDAIERIRYRILTISVTYLSLVVDELARAEDLLNASEPNFAAALFHAYRSIDGYLAAVIIKPISSVLIQPFATLFAEKQLASHQRTIARTLGKNLRNALLSRICSDEDSRKALEAQLEAFETISKVRHLVVHGFKQPSRWEVQMCITIARTLTSLLERERQKARAAENIEVSEGEPPEAWVASSDPEVLEQIVKLGEWAN